MQNNNIRTLFLWALSTINKFRYRNKSWLKTAWKSNDWTKIQELNISGQSLLELNSYKQSMAMLSYWRNLLLGCGSVIVSNCCFLSVSYIAKHQPVSPGKTDLTKQTFELQGLLSIDGQRSNKAKRSAKQQRSDLVIVFLIQCSQCSVDQTGPQKRRATVLSC